MANLLDAVRERVVVLDGGLATELERRGHDLSSVLWWLAAAAASARPTSPRSPT